MKLLDCSCLVHLFKRIEEPRVVLEWKKQGYLIVIPDNVYEELCKNDETINKVNPYIREGSIIIIPGIKKDDLDKFKARHPTLGNGEISVILTAKDLSNRNKRYYAIIDDKKARKVAEKYGVKLSNTFGLLFALREKSLISEEYYLLIKEKFNKNKCFDVDRLEYECGNNN